MSYLGKQKKATTGLANHTLKAVAAGVLLSLSSGAYAACDYTAGDDFDGDGVTNLVDAVPCDADLQVVGINKMVNSDFEAGANFWTTAGLTYSSVEGFKVNSKAISMTGPKKKSIVAPTMSATGITSLTLNFWVKAETINDLAAVPKIKMIVDAAPGGTNSKGKTLTVKNLISIQVGHTADPDLTDNIPVYDATEWIPVSQTWDFAQINIESQIAIDTNGFGTLINLDADGKYTGNVTFKIQHFANNDVLLIDDMSIYSNTDKDTMVANKTTDTDNDGLMNDVDPRPTQAYYTESKPSDDFDGDGAINSEDALPYEPNFTTDMNNDGYADEQTAPLTNALSDTLLEYTDAENDNWNASPFSSVKDALVGETSYKIDNSKESKSKTITIAANNQVSFGFWAKTDDNGINADGEALTVKVTLVGANADTTDVEFSQVLNKADLTTDWQYFQIDQLLDDSQTATQIKFNFVNPVTANAGNIWIDGVVAFADPDTEALATVSTLDTDSDGLLNFMDNDDDNDGLLDGEDPQPLVAFGSYELPDIDQDGDDDTLDVSPADGKLDIFNADLTAPVITLIGEANITITEGETYTDQGVTATDEVDGDVSDSVVIVNSVDTSMVGEYTVTYDVSDAAGNAAIQVVRTITVKSNDTTAPVFSGTLPDLTFNKATPSSAITLSELTSAPIAVDEKDGEIIAITKFKDGVYQPGNTYVITWIATDAAGNSSETTQNLTVTAPEVVIEEVEGKGGSFSFAGLFLMLGLFTRRLFSNKK